LTKIVNILGFANSTFEVKVVIASLVVKELKELKELSLRSSFGQGVKGVKGVIASLVLRTGS